jgi:hypothetical protein
MLSARKPSQGERLAARAYIVNAAPARGWFILGQRWAKCEMREETQLQSAWPLRLAEILSLAWRLACQQGVEFRSGSARGLACKSIPLHSVGRPKAHNLARQHPRQPHIRNPPDMMYGMAICRMRSPQRCALSAIAMPDAAAVANGSAVRSTAVTPLPLPWSAGRAITAPSNVRPVPLPPPCALTATASRPARSSSMWLDDRRCINHGRWKRQVPIYTRRHGHGSTSKILRMKRNHCSESTPCVRPT